MSLQARELTIKRRLLVASLLDCLAPFSLSPKRKLAAMIPNSMAQDYMAALKSARH
jgi:hypothetical protein